MLPLHYALLVQQRIIFGCLIFAVLSLFAIHCDFDCVFEKSDIYLCLKCDV